MTSRSLLYLVGPLVLFALLFGAGGCDEPDIDDLTALVYKLVIRPAYVDPGVAEFEAYMGVKGFHDGGEFQFAANEVDEFFDAALSYRPGAVGTARAQGDPEARELRGLKEAMRLP